MEAKAKDTGTGITFIMRGGNDDERLDDIQFGNKSSVAFTGENDMFIDDGKFNLTNVEYADWVLSIPLRHGWRSQDYFLFGRHFKSKVFLTPGSTKAFHYVPSPLGCLASILLLPLTPFITFLIEKGIFGEKKDVVVKPVFESIDSSAP